MATQTTTSKESTKTKTATKSKVVSGQAIEANIYNQKGQISGKITLPKKVFGAKWRADMVHQVVEGMRSNQRAGTADTKGRGEVRGGGKKPWKQKGTGRARHGSTRSPIWVGGGVTHGPLAEKNYKKKISKKMRAQALFSVLSKKLQDGELVFVDSLGVTEMKTKGAIAIMNDIAGATKIKNLVKAKKPKILTAFYEGDENKQKSFRNIPALDLVSVKTLNPLDVLNHRFLVIENPEESVKFLESRG